MGRADYLKLGDWNAICFRCGRKFKASTMLKNWQGFWTCERDFEPRQPQDYVKGVPDVQSPPWTQPPPGDIFVKFCTPNSRSSIPGYGTPGCMIPGFVDPAFDPTILENP